MLGKIKQMCLNSHLLCPVVDPFEDLPEGALPYSLLLGEDDLRVHFLQQTDNNSQKSGGTEWIIFFQGCGS